MRIALTGTHGTGKSTLLQELINREILLAVEPCYDHWHYKILDGIGLNGKSVHLGRFELEIDAARSYNEAALQRSGEFARLNILPEERVCG